MEEILNSAVAVALIVTPLVKSMVNAFKPFIKDSRFYPIISILIGLVTMVGIGTSTGEALPTSIIAGVIAGLGASGLYGLEGGKNESNN